MKMAYFVSALVFLTNCCLAQEHAFDTVKSIADGLNAARADLIGHRQQVDNISKGVIFVESESVSPNKYLDAEVEFDDIVIVFTPSLSLFHFSINKFLLVKRVEIGEVSARISIWTKNNILEEGNHLGDLVFTLNGDSWQFKEWSRSPTDE